MQSPSSGLNTRQQPQQQSQEWPKLLAYLAAFLFVAASSVTNLMYGLAKGTDLATSMVWAAVAIATSIIFSLSWPALLAALDQRKLAQCVMVAVALLLSGAYSVSAALGSASGGRANAAITETATTDARTRAQVAYDAAKSELAALKPARTVGELQAMRDGWKRAYRSEPWVLEPELARAKRRAELEQKIERATADLAKSTPTKQANSDTVALMGYLAAVGITATSDTVNRWLVILAVLLIECGGGLSLAVGLSLSQTSPAAPSRTELSGAGSGQDTARPPQPSSGHAEHVPDTLSFGRALSDRTTGHAAPDTSLKALPIADQSRPDTPDTSPSGTPDATDRNAAGVRFLAFLQDRGGVLVSGQREIGRTMGWSKSWTHEVLHGLAATGLVKLSTGKSGTVVKLLPVACKVRGVA